MALSIASTGLSFGGVILTPLSILMVDFLGFNTAAPSLGVIYLLGVVPVSWMFLRVSPESMGLLPDGEKSELKPAYRRSADAESEDDGISFHQALRGRFFWGLSLAYIFLMAAQVGGIAHQYGLVREQLSEAETAIVVAILPVFSIIGRLFGGWIVDQMSIRTFAIAMMLVQALSLTILSTGYSVGALCIGLAMFGASVGNLLMLQPLLIAEAFGVKSYSRIFSLSNLMSSCGTAIGPALLGVIYAASSNVYQIPYVTAALFGALGLSLFIFGGKIIN